MKHYQEDEIPKHRKSGRKRAWKITWYYTGGKTVTTTNVKTGERTKEPMEEDPFWKSFLKPWSQRYHSEKAAKQALESWQDGKSMTWKSPKHWRAEISCDK